MQNTLLGSATASQAQNQYSQVQEMCGGDAGVNIRCKLQSHTQSQVDGVLWLACHPCFLQIQQWPLKSRR